MAQDEIQVITRSTEDGVTDEIFFENFGEGTSSSTVPSALMRWAEEGQILDPQGIHYCIAALKPEILPVLLKRQAEEIAKGREEEQKKKADAQAKAAASKKEEEEKKKNQETKESGGESSTTCDGQSTSTEADEGASAEAQNEVMQVEQQPEDADVSEPPASEAAASEDTAMVVRMYTDEPSDETSVTSADNSVVRTSTPVNESEGNTSSTTMPATPASSVVQDIITAATMEAASLSTVGNDQVATPDIENPQGSVNEAERTEQETAQQGDEGSPMAMEEEGTAATPRGESAQTYDTELQLWYRRPSIHFCASCLVFSKFSQNCPSHEATRAIWRTLKIQVKLILNCPRVLAITCLSQRAKFCTKDNFQGLAVAKQVCRLS